MTAKSRRGIVSILAAACLLAFAAGALAQPQAPKPPATFFSDSTGSISASDGARIEQALRDLERTSSNQVLVVVQDRLPEGYADVAEYANRVAQAWRVGDEKRDNGAVVFVFLGDRRVRIEVGYGLEGALPDALAARIIEDEIAPRFREGQYGAGLIAAVDAITRATRGEYQPKPRGMSRDDKRLLVAAIVFFLLIGVVIPFLNEVRGMRDYRTYSGRGSRRGRILHGSHWGGGWGGGWSSGGGSFGGGGGFRGGGGSFGGGGASGSW